MEDILTFKPTVESKGDLFSEYSVRQNYDTDMPDQDAFIRKGIFLIPSTGSTEQTDLTRSGVIKLWEEYPDKVRAGEIGYDFDQALHSRNVCGALSIPENAIFTLPMKARDTIYLCSMGSQDSVRPLYTGLFSLHSLVEEVDKPGTKWKALRAKKFYTAEQVGHALHINPSLTAYAVPSLARDAEVIGIIKKKDCINFGIENGKGPQGAQSFMTGLGAQSFVKKERYYNLA